MDILLVNNRENILKALDMSQQLRAWVSSQHACGNLHMGVIIFSSGLIAFFWPLKAPGTHGVHIYMHTNTYTSKI